MHTRTKRALASFGDHRGLLLLSLMSASPRRPTNPEQGVERLEAKDPPQGRKGNSTMDNGLSPKGKHLEKSWRISIIQLTCCRVTNGEHLPTMRPEESGPAIKGERTSPPEEGLWKLPLWWLVNGQWHLRGRESGDTRRETYCVRWLPCLAPVSFVVHPASSLPLKASQETYPGPRRMFTLDFTRNPLPSLF